MYPFTCMPSSINTISASNTYYYVLQLWVVLANDRDRSRAWSTNVFGANMYELWPEYYQFWYTGTVKPRFWNDKDCNIKKETNLEAYISVNFLQILTKSAPQIIQIFPAFQRDAL